ncbi:MAG: type II toxin-antitoxin system YoeB family toxin [Candidatus Woesearchaeota archaeon]|nr:type II toxin-antitoxin system YoeB family toxin [Candidatus Woesearchaeota archaeon]
MNSEVYFCEEKLKIQYEKLSAGRSEDKELHKWISDAIIILKKDAFSGIQIPKKLIPRIYLKKYKIDNLWKLNLNKSWRLLYSVAGSKVEIISIILEWMNHKEYEKRFNY